MTSDSADAAVRKIARSPKLLAECRDKVALVARLTGRLDKTQVYAALQPAIILWGLPDHGDEDATKDLDRFWLETYTKAFRDLPLEALEYGVSEFIRAGRSYGKFPLPEHIVKHAEPKAQELRKVAWRMQKAAEAAAEAPPAEIPAEVRAANAQKVAEVARQLAARGMPLVPASRLNARRTFGRA